MNINLTLFGQMLAFAGFVIFCLKFIWPPLIEALEERKSRIDKGLKDATEAQEKLNNASVEAEKVIEEAKAQSSSILARANKRSLEIVDEARNKAKEEGERIIASAHLEIDKEIASAKESLKLSLGGLVVEGVQAITGEKAMKEPDALVKSLTEKL